tara:strand:- start:1339 stop:2181 length:843 start_codon:yes stop_codon:yes gene_type:complete
MPEEKTKLKFILGLGAQRAGTTWLFNYLLSRDNFTPGFDKEFHVFDTATIKECFGFRKDLEKSAAQSRFVNAKIIHDDVIRLKMISNPDLYFEYCLHLLKTPGINITADITPSYSGLSSETLEYIKDEFTKRNIEVLPIFIIREPVRRLASMAKLQLYNQSMRPTKNELILHMQKLVGSSQDRLRSDYKKTITNLENVFGKKIFISFFEELFSSSSVQSLCEFLGIHFTEASYRQTINQLDESIMLTQDDLSAFSEYYQEQYDFVHNKFGHERTRALWKI